MLNWFKRQKAKFDDYIKRSYVSMMDERIRDFKNDANYFFLKRGRGWKDVSEEDMEFILNVGGAIYSIRGDGFALNFIKSPQFYDGFGQYMNGGKGYTLPRNIKKKVESISHLELLTLSESENYFGERMGKAVGLHPAFIDELHERDFGTSTTPNLLEELKA